MKEVDGKVAEKLPPGCLVPCQAAEQMINVRMLLIMVTTDCGKEFTCKDELEV